MHSVHRNRFRYTCNFQNGRCDVDHVMELGADLPLGLDSLWPMDNGAVACAAKVRSDLLGPLIRSVHGMRPADGVMIVGFRPAQLVDPGSKVFGSLHGL